MKTSPVLTHPNFLRNGLVAAFALGALTVLQERFGRRVIERPRD